MLKKSLLANNIIQYFHITEFPPQLTDGTEVSFIVQFTI